MTERNSPVTDTDPSTILAEMQARADGATDGPWHHQPWGGQNQNGDYSGGEVFDAYGEYLIHDVSDEDGRFIAHARTDVPWLIEYARQRDAALTAVLDLHSPFVWDFGQGPVESCRGCSDMGAVDHDYPCPTVRTITNELGGDRG